MKKAIEQIVIRPVVTEKCTEKREAYNIYCFEVLKQATKHEIKNVMKKIYGVNVEKINIVNKKGKVKRRRNIEGQQKDWKKAYIKLKKGEKLQIFEGIS